MSTQTSTQPTVEQLLARIAQLEADKAKASKVHFKVGEKGGVSVYGINSRFPVTVGESKESSIRGRASCLRVRFPYRP